MWKKRRRNQPKNKDQLPATDIEQQPRKSFGTDFNFWKIFPFSKRRREALIQDVFRGLMMVTFAFLLA
jgi:hypothetical protein